MFDRTNITKNEKNNCKYNSEKLFISGEYEK